MATVAELDAVFGADTREFDAGLDSVQRGIGGLGTVAIGAAAAAGAAIAGMAATSITAFTDFDTGMREVFTLLPGVTEEAMDAMSEQALDLGADIGRLPDEVVPALYQSISAGVPPENVFDFLETANAAATGGVTDLTTAVDGLTTVTNAYGTEVITASEASDMMFTAVRLGKTNFEELSGSLGRVIPTASAMGITFDEVLAVITTLTTQGIATSEAVTGLKAAMSNILKPTQDAAQGFIEVAEVLVRNGDLTGPLADQVLNLRDRQNELATSLSDMAAAGMEGTDAFNALQEEYEDSIKGNDDLAAALNAAAIEQVGLTGFIQAAQVATGGQTTELSKMFGSTEALNAILATTSEQGASMMISVLDEMQSSTGATNTAFERMDSGIQASFNRLRVAWENIKVRVGQSMSDTFKEAVDFITVNVMPILEDVILATFDAIGAAILWVRDHVIPTVALAFAFMRDDSNPIMAAFQALIEATFQAIEAAFQLGVTAWETILKPAWEAIQPLATAIWNAVGGIILATITAATEVLQGFAAFLSGDWEDGWNHMKAAVQTINDALVAGIETIWQGLRDTLSGLWQSITSSARQNWNIFQQVMINVFNTVGDAVVQTWNDIINATNGAWNGIQTFVVEKALAISAAIADIFHTAVTAVVGFFRDLGPQLVDFVSRPINQLIGQINNMIDRLNAIEINLPPISIPKITIPNPFGDDWRIGGQEVFPGVNISPPDIPHIPTLARGGIVRSPTLAMIGEAGPEAVVPLNRAPTAGNQTIIVQLDGRTITQQVVRHMPSIVRLQGIGI